MIAENTGGHRNCQQKRADALTPRGTTKTESQRDFMQVMAANGVTVPTANHAFGWDAIKFAADLESRPGRSCGGDRAFGIRGDLGRVK
jgi:hypothetical protein